jgi:hypothetical protein
MSYALGGGAGSGMGSLLSGKVYDEFPSLFRMSNILLPNEK